MFTGIGDEASRFWRQLMTAPCAIYGAEFKIWVVAGQFTSQWKLPRR